ncbi:P-loop containing nucleoside triphosphate hydrolase protein [Cladochytrium replicatum]|nr:P-loop containing nucleoside triphosphate hydrolase protein [Cladochytrium replicatum]
MSSLFAHNCIHLSPTAEKLYGITYNVIDLVKPLSERVSDILSTLPKPPAHFIGRDDVLSEIQKQLVNHGAVILVAHGGMGKSSVALQFAKQNQKSYDSIFWIPCNTAATAVSSMCAYAESQFGLVGFESMDSADIVSFMGDNLTKFHRYLLILDNVDDESVLDQILVSTLSGDVVVTSRSNAGLAVKMRKWTDPLAKNVQVQTWPSNITHKFLKQRLDQKFDYLTVDQNVVDALNKLIQHIDGLPLAAEQAAAFMEREQTNFSVLVRRITSYLAENPDPRLGVASVSLAAIIRAGLDTIGNAASLLMQALSFYASRDIPFDLVDQVVVLLSESEVEGIKKSDFNSLELLRKLPSQSLQWAAAQVERWEAALIERECVCVCVFLCV